MFPRFVEKRRTRRQIILHTKRADYLTFLRNIHMKAFTRKYTTTIRSCINTSAWFWTEISIREIRQEMWRFLEENSIIIRNLHGIFMLMRPWRIHTITSSMLTHGNLQAASDELNIFDTSWSQVQSKYPHKLIKEIKNAMEILPALDGAFSEKNWMCGAHLPLYSWIRNYL